MKNQTKKEKVDQMLRVWSRITEMSSPQGLLTGIADEAGCSREYVRQRARALGLLTSRETIEQRVLICVYCGKGYKGNTSSRYCSNKCAKECHFYSHHLLKICKNCGLGFLTNKGRTNGGGNVQIFCNKTCYGEWFGKHYGGARNRIIRKRGVRK